MWSSLLSQSDESLFRQLFNLSPDPVWIIENNRFVECNEAAVQTLGYETRQALLNVHPSQLSPEQQPDGEESYIKAERMMALAVEKGLRRFEWVHAKADGSTFYAEVTLTAIEMDGSPAIYCVWRDVSERKEQEFLLKESEQHYRTLANGGSTLIWTSGLDKLCNYFNEPWLRFTGRSLEMEFGNGWAEGVHPDDFDQCLRTYVQCFDLRQPFSMEYRLRRADGVYRWIRDDGNPRYDSEGSFIGYIGFCMDVTERREAEETIKSMAYYDPLTGLPNRRLLQDRLETALASAERHRRVGAVMYIDLDNFKTVNDTHGHNAGDALLQEAAGRLTNCLRKCDTAARLGGDEFVVFLDFLDQNLESARSQARIVAQKVLEALGKDYVIGGKPCACTPSIGVALFQGGGKTVEDIFKDADQQMYKVKREGRNNVAFLF